MPTEQLPTDAVVPNSGEGGAAWLLRTIDDLFGDITPEQWAEIAATARATDIAEAIEMLKKHDALGPCPWDCGARVILAPEQAGTVAIAG